jgi:hypothetical protein
LSEILDDTLVTNEKADNTKKLKNEFTLFKVDFEKVYDSMEY